MLLLRLYKGQPRDQMLLLRKLKRPPSAAVSPQFIIRSLSNVIHPRKMSSWVSSDQMPRRQVRWFSGVMTGSVLVQARDPAKLSLDIETALDERRYDDAWRLFEQHLSMEGWYPRRSVVNKLIGNFAESLDVRFLERAGGLVERIVEEGKENLLDEESLIYLSFCLAKCGLSVEASTVLRRLIENQHYPPVAAWSAALAHMSLAAPGAALAAELVAEIGYLFLDGRIDPRKKSNAPLIAMKPNADTFSVALAGCLSFGLTRKAEQLIDMLPRLNIKVNVDLLVIMAHIYERNGRREELKKLQRHIDEAVGITESQYRQFYNCLLVCHLKLGELDSACEMVLKMLRKAKEARDSLATATFIFQVGNKSLPEEPSPRSINHRRSDCVENIMSSEGVIAFGEFSRDRKFRMLEADMKKVLGVLLTKMQTQVELVTTQRGILQPTEELYVKLTKAFLVAGKTKELTMFLIKAEKEDSPASNDDSILVQVINSCISIAWLDQAHDLLDEMRLAGVRASSSVYASLLKEYCDANRVGEAQALVRDAHRAGVQLDSTSYELLIKSKAVEKDNKGALHLFQEMKQAKLPKGGHVDFYSLLNGCAENGEPRIMSKLLREIKDGQVADSGVHDWNNVIHLFCKKRMMQDAEKALEKMRSLGHSPNAQTFHSMVTGYAAVGGKYLEVTVLWGEMKSLASSTSMTFDQELLDSVLYTFVRGGFLVRANEVVDMMEKGGMFIDKFKYRTLFLKYHRTLYKGKPSKSRTEVQLKRRAAATTFKKWLGLD